MPGGESHRSTGGQCASGEERKDDQEDTMRAGHCAKKPSLAGAKSEKGFRSQRSGGDSVVSYTSTWGASGSRDLIGATMSADIGLIGLAVMGENLVLNVESRGFTVAVFNRTVSKVDDFVGGRGKGKKFIGCKSVEELCKSLKRPRKVGKERT